MKRPWATKARTSRHPTPNELKRDGESSGDGPSVAGAEKKKETIMNTNDKTGGAPKAPRSDKAQGAPGAGADMAMAMRSKNASGGAGTAAPGSHPLLQKRGFFSGMSKADRLWGAGVALFGAAAALFIVGRDITAYESLVLAVAIAASVWLVWLFKPMRLFLLASAGLSLAAVALYGNDLGAAESNFALKYVLSSQSAILWQCFLNVASFVAFAIGFALDVAAHSRARRSQALASDAARSPGAEPGGKTSESGKTANSDNILISLAIGMTWASACAGLVGLIVRWRESYMISSEVGHIPVSNLYEVVVLFMVIVSLMFLYYSKKFSVKSLGAFASLLQVVLVSFLLWYSLSRNAQEIQPLVPALQSWWMKLHVPANFIGYGGFCLGAMLAVAELISLRYEGLAQRGEAPFNPLPSSEAIENVIYKCIAAGFFFFTIATILGAFWAADAWGRYWSWDPKETWALIVWLNYAAWLHIRLVGGKRGKALAWWALAGFGVTAFAFVGVNIFLTGLHSYGAL